MLERFVKAQEKTYAAALAELRAGEKRGHWIWWVFPQMRGLGTSEYSVFYGLEDALEARAYLQHPVLGARYRECVEVVYDQLFIRGQGPLVLMGSEVDVKKLRSSLELLLDQVLHVRSLPGAELLAEKMHRILVDKLGWRHPLAQGADGWVGYKRLGQTDMGPLLSSGHVLISGISGTGKSLLLNCWGLPWLRARGHPYVVCDFHGCLDPLPRALVFDPDRQSPSDIAALASDALSGSTLMVRTDVGWSNGVEWGLFISAIVAQVKAGRGPTKPWFLVIDVSSHCYDLAALWEFLSVAKSYGCTVIVSAQCAGRLPAGVADVFSVHVQFQCSSLDVLPLGASDPVAWGKLIANQQPRQLMLKVNGAAPVGCYL